MILTVKKIHKLLSKHKKKVLVKNKDLNLQNLKSKFFNQYSNNLSFYKKFNQQSRN
jgi:hypothetical protein